MRIRTTLERRSDRGEIDRQQAYDKAQLATCDLYGHLRRLPGPQGVRGRLGRMNAQPLSLRAITFGHLERLVGLRVRPWCVHRPSLA
ncbi:hypothetical protein ACWELO_04415 [Streptomyces sp. NPDC004596]|uniref:hypothetical protein n=1 Tax=Streptomyces sp. DSM 118148 TaxID=3448667 RepID=UPI00403FCA56